MWKKELDAQGRLMQNMIELCERSNKGGGKVDQKKERMRALLKPDGGCRALRKFKPTR